MLYRIMNGLVAIPAAQPYLYPSSGRTRGHHLQLRQQNCRISVYQHSYFPSVVCLWNVLPSTAVSAPSIEVFKSRLSSVTLREVTDAVFYLHISFKFFLFVTALPLHVFLRPRTFFLHKVQQYSVRGMYYIGRRRRIIASAAASASARTCGTVLKFRKHLYVFCKKEKEKQFDLQRKWIVVFLPFVSFDNVCHVNHLACLEMF